MNHTPEPLPARSDRTRPAGPAPAQAWVFVCPKCGRQVECYLRRVTLIWRLCDVPMVPAALLAGPEGR